jgi:hypothetical protein
MRCLHIAFSALVVIATAAIEAKVDSSSSYGGQRANANESREQTDKKDGSGNNPLEVSLTFEVLQGRDSCDRNPRSLAAQRMAAKSLRKNALRDAVR